MENIVIQEMIGGLGNQMFEYAFIKALSLRTGSNFLLDKSPFELYYKLHDYDLENLNIEKNYAKKHDIPFYNRLNPHNKIYQNLRSICSLLNPYHHNEFLDYYFKPQVYHDNFKNIKKGYFSGVFPSELYFLDQWNNIKKDFQFINHASPKTELIKKTIIKNNSISVHIRRGNYLDLKNIYRILDKNYYKEAINIINKKVDSPLFVFFSNDMDRVYKNFGSIKNSIFVSHNKGKDNWQDMYLMSYCKHNIIANSSFSWRGGYLNNNPEKIVISPKRWFVEGHKFNFNDINPVKWLMI